MPRRRLRVRVSYIAPVCVALRSCTITKSPFANCNATQGWGRMLGKIGLLTVKIHTQNERPARAMKILVNVKDYVALSFPILYVVSSSVGRAPDCDSGCRGFKPHLSTQLRFAQNLPTWSVMRMKVQTNFRSEDSPIG